jgi:VWFA-related protein
VEFFAVATGGLAVADLTTSDLVLKVDGRPRTIRSLQWIALAAPVPVLAGGSPPVALPPPFGSNSLSDAGRAIVLALEDESLATGRERPLRDAVDRFLRYLTPRDRVALVTMPYGGLKVDFTADHERVRQSLSAIAGQGARDESGSDAACRTRRTLESLAGLLKGLSNAEGPTTIVFITSGLVGPRRDAPAALAPGMCELTVEHFQQVGAAASTARAHFYIVQPEDTMLGIGQPMTETIAGGNFRGSDNRSEGIENLSGVTGGRRLHLASAGDDTLARIVRETSGYYLAAFEADRGERNGLRHRLDITTTRAAASIRARPDVVIPRGDAPGGRPTPPTPHTMLREVRIFRDLPLRAVGFASRDADDKVKVIVLAEAEEPAVKLRSAAVGLFDQKGRLTAQSTPEAGALEVTPLMAGMVVASGLYRLRVAATDDTGRTGTADYSLDAALVPVGPLAVSSMMLGVSRAGGFVPRLQFGTEPVALAYLEIYGATNGAPVSVALELATSVNGPAKLTIPAAVDETRDASRRIVTGAVAIGSLPAGDYIIRGVVTVAGQGSGRVLRTLRKR